MSPAIVNHISGFSGTTVSITLTPVQVEPTPPPALELRRDGAGHLVLKLTNLRPGTYYTIERSDGLQPNSWNFLVSLPAIRTLPMRVERVPFTTASRFATPNIRPLRHVLTPRTKNLHSRFHWLQFSAAGRSISNTLSRHRPSSGNTRQTESRRVGKRSPNPILWKTPNARLRALGG